MTCPGCDSRTTQAESLLGRLGSLLWFRCRYCGIEFSKVIAPKKLKKLGVE